MVGSDLFDRENKKYVLKVDHYSKYMDVVKLSQTTSSSVINVMKSVLACHGIPQTLRTDNGPQYSSSQFKTFLSVRSTGLNMKPPVLIFKLVMGSGTWDTDS